MVQRTPVPDLSPADQFTLASFAQRGWSLTRSLDTRTENSQAFHLPALLRVPGASLTERATTHLARVADAEAEFARSQGSIDDICFALYGITDADRRSIEQDFGGASDDTETEAEAEADDADDETEVDAGPMTGSLISWATGAAFGRFDVCLATGERPTPPEPDPFDPLPACSPGMLTGDDGLPLAAPPPGYAVAWPTDGILVDDPGADRDLVARVRQVFGVVFGTDGDDRLREAVDLLDPAADDLRPWFRKTFFDAHIKRYSKSRRKAPIYWQLGTPSGSYSVWIYIHRMGPDTLHAVLRDHVEPKLRFEDNRLAALRSEAGNSPAPSQRADIDAQERLVDELRAFRDELQRVAPLWDPDLDDGVVINASFLHRLFAHTTKWQKECEGHWAQLQAGDYDWAHLAMRLWPERVVPACTEDRSLAIAHGLEDTLWAEDDKGKWHPRLVSEATLDELVAERTSPAVKDALNQLASAPAPAKPARGQRKKAPRPRPTPKAPAPRRETQLPLDLASPSTGPAPAALDALRAALHNSPAGANKSDLLAAAGLAEDAWKPAIDALVASGEVERTGKARGTRYHLRRTD